MLRARLLTGALILASSAITLVSAAPAAAQTMTPSTPIVKTAPAAMADDTMDTAAQVPTVEEQKVGVWRATDDWANSWQGWDIDGGGPAILFVRR